jgi:hypothetical protein
VKEWRKFTKTCASFKSRAGNDKGRIDIIECYQQELLNTISSLKTELLILNTVLTNEDFELSTTLAGVGICVAAGVVAAESAIWLGGAGLRAFVGGAISGPLGLVVGAVGTVYTIVHYEIHQRKKKEIL